VDALIPVAVKKSMKTYDSKMLMQDGDYHIDPMGRLVIDNVELLQALHGALNQSQYYDMMTDVGCSNSGCVV
jgi:hypothetical protein